MREPSTGGHLNPRRGYAVDVSWSVGFENGGSVRPQLPTIAGVRRASDATAEV